MRSISFLDLNIDKKYQRLIVLKITYMYLLEPILKVKLLHKNKLNVQTLKWAFLTQQPWIIYPINYRPWNDQIVSPSRPIQ